MHWGMITKDLAKNLLEHSQIFIIISFIKEISVES